jgi:hypothetical protein
VSTDELTVRAFRAYFRSGGIDQPANYSGPVDWKGKHFIVLRNCRGVLAAYSVSPSGHLRRVWNVPSALESW